jgi:hypothetical protein
MKSVLYLRRWVASELGQFEGNNDVEYVLHYIRKNLKHPLYTEDPVNLLEWDKFLKTVDCHKILNFVV